MEELIVVGICLFINAILAGAEMAFVSVGKPRLRELARTGNKEALRILSLRDNPERTLSVIQVGITVVGAIGAAVGGAGVEEWLSPVLQVKFDVSENTAEAISIVALVVPLTYLSVVIGELVPKSLALRNPLWIVLKTARWLVLFDRILAPVVSVLEWSTKKFLKTFFRRAKGEMAPSVPDTVELDQLSSQARQYVLNLVNIEKKRVKDVFLPWEHVVTVDQGQSIEDVEQVVLSSGHTRLPVVNADGVIGVMNTKELLALRKAGAEKWDSIVRPMVQVQESDSMLKALRQMQEKRSHLSIVYAAQLRTGIVTMEDVLEEIIGDVFDEDDDGALTRILSTGSTFRTTGPAADRNS